jgi:hypothetical protein
MLHWQCFAKGRQVAYHFASLGNASTVFAAVLKAFDALPVPISGSEVYLTKDGGWGRSSSSNPTGVSLNCRNPRKSDA